jgi:type IV secretory pathway protease TraF
MKRPAHRAGRFVCFTNVSIRCRAVTLSDSEVFLMNSQSADSLDGSYFGVLPTATIIAKAVSLWTWLGG